MTYSEWRKKKREEEALTAQEKAMGVNSNIPAGGMSYEEWRKMKRAEAAGKSYTPVTFTTDDTDDIAPVNTDTWIKSGEGNILDKTVGTMGDIALGLQKGMMRPVEGLTDLVGYGTAGLYDLFGNDEFADIVRRRTQKSWVDEFGTVAVPGGRIDMHDMVDAYSILGDKSDAIVEGVGQVSGMLLTGAAGAAAGLGAGGVSALTTATTGLSSMGTNIGEAYKAGASDGQAFVYGLTTGAIEAGTELLFGGLGKGVKALGLSRGIGGIDDMLAKGLSDKITKLIAKDSVKKVVGNTIEALVKATGEGVEEVASGLGSALMKKLTYASEEEWQKLVADEKLLESFIVGAVTSGIMQGGDYVKANANKTDFVTGRTSAEEKVIQRAAEKEIAQKEANGEKLTKKQKNEIYDRLTEDISRGYISIDTIEEALGGDKYTEYKKASDENATLKKELDELRTLSEYDSLRNMKSGDRTDIQNDRLAELKGKNLSDMTEEQKSRLAELETKYGENTKTLEDMKKQMSDDVLNLAKSERKGKGSLLMESYNEKARRGEGYTVDLSAIDSKKQDTYKRAMDAGILNNTNRTHDFVDLIATLESERGVKIDFVNNQKLKESGFAVDGAIVNGVKTDNGILLNVESARSLDTVVGHEIAHVLEGTELYQALQDSIIKYAQSKGDYDTRYANIAKLYKTDDDIKIKGELTADLVGDYLFTDEKFIKSLTANPNVFQKVFNEIKYLVKIATSGSEAKRKLLEVQRAFERAFADSKAAAKGKNTQLSVSATEDGTKYVKLDGNIFLKEDGSEMSPTEAYNALVDKPITLEDGDVINFVKKLPNIRLYHELFKKYPGHDGSVDMKSLNQAINKNIVDVFAVSVATKRNEAPKHDHEGIVDFDLREVYIADDSNAYRLELYVANLINGNKVAYVKRYVERASQEIAEKIKKAEMVRQTHLNQPSKVGEVATGNATPFSSSISQNSEKSRDLEKISEKGQFSLSESASYAEIAEEQQKLYQRENDLRERKRAAENDPELLQAMDEYHSLFDEMRELLSKRKNGTATQSELDRIEEIKALRDERMKRVTELQESLGLGAIAEEEKEIRETKEELRVASDAAWAREGAEKENVAIEKSGLSAEEYFRKKALKAFKTTTNFNEAGYMLPDGKMLNFSGGERNHRYRDHREIGEIYEATQGTAALNRFLNDGNIRIMAESPGIDIASGVEPTQEQYDALRRFIKSHGVNEGQFFVDISDTDGRRVGQYAYEGRVNAERVINDIKYFYQTGEVREQSSIGQFLSLSNADDIAPVGKYSNLGIQKDVSASSDIAPVKERATKNLPIYDVDHTPVVDEAAQLQAQIDTATAEIGTLDDAMAQASTEDEYRAILDKRVKALEQRNALVAQLTALENADKTDRAAYLDSLTDEDAPPEIEAPLSLEDGDIDPLADRDIDDVGSRKIKAYMYENPEVKPFFQKEAAVMLGELKQTTKGERWYNDDLYYETNGEAGFGGTQRKTTADIAYLLDEFNYTYAEIEKGLKAIIEDHGAENNACSKRIEFLINSRLLNGYNSFDAEIPYSQDYRDFVREKQITEYSDEARARFFATADNYAPTSGEDIAPLSMDSVDKAVDNAEDIDTKGLFVDSPKREYKKANWLNTFRTHVLDDASVFEDLAKKTKNRELEAKFNFIKSAKARAQSLIGNGKKDAGVKSLNSIRQTVEKTGKTAEFEDYMYHLLNIDRMTLEDRYEGATNKPVFDYDVTADISEAKVRQYEAQNPRFKRLADEIYKYMQYERQLMVDNGIISQETADLWQEQTPHYIPIKRAVANDDPMSLYPNKRIKVDSTIKRVKGGNQPIEHLFNTIASRTESVYNAIAKNNFGLELKNTLNTVIDSNVATRDDVDNGVDRHDDLLQAGKDGRNPTFTVFENGEKVTFEISHDMYEALKPTEEMWRGTSKVVSTVNSLRRGVLTEYNPAFLVTNAIKDAQDVLINSQHAAKTYANFPKAVKELKAKGEWYTEYMENGGEQNTYFEKDGEFAKDDTGIKKIIGIPFNAISYANNFIERIPRLAEYIASRENGASIETAMLDAARVTTNFQAGGDITKFLNRNGATFLNASVQGFMQNVRNVREAKMNGLKGVVQLIGKTMVAGLPALILNHLLWGDDEEYEELSDYVKDNYYVVAKYGDGNFVRIPKGRTAAVIQKAFEQMENLITGDDEVDFGSFFELVISNLAPNNPLDNNIIAPIAQAMSNTTWYGEDLVPTRLQDLPASEQYDESTDAVSKWLGENMGISPYKINYVLDQYLGGIGDIALPMLTPEAERGDNSLLAPLADKFTTDSVMKNQNVSDFYDTVDKLTVNANSSAATDEDILKSKYMNSINAELGELYKKKREIQNSTLSDSAKYNAVRETQKQINDLAKQSLDTYDEVYINGDYARVGDRHYRTNADGEWQKITDEQLEKMNTVTKGLGISADEYWGKKQEYDFAYEYPEKYEIAEKVGGYDKYMEYQDGMKDMKLAEKVDYVASLNLTAEQKNALINGETTRKEPIDMAEYGKYSSLDEMDFAKKNPEKYAVTKAVGGYSAYTKYSAALSNVKGVDNNGDGKSDSGTRKTNVINYLNDLDIPYGVKIILYRNEYNGDDTYNYDIVKYLEANESLTYQEKIEVLVALGMTVDAEGNVWW